jgi:hypothetical protein
MFFQRQPGLFDLDERAAKLTALGDPLVKLKAEIDFEAFRQDLNRVHEKPRKSNAGAKPFDVVLMFMVLIVQQLYNLSDDGLEYQIRDRLSFMRFFGAAPGRSGAGCQDRMAVPGAAEGAGLG